MFCGKKIKYLFSPQKFKSLFHTRGIRPFFFVCLSLKMLWNQGRFFHGVNHKMLPSFSVGIEKKEKN